jgi:hypothetical protein
MDKIKENAEIEEIEEIVELIYWNLSFGISIKETLIDIDRLYMLEYFENNK